MQEQAFSQRRSSSQRRRRRLGMGWALALVAIAACARTQPGTYVELVDKEGTQVYVAGAAGPGLSQTEACRAAVARAVAAIALKFAQRHDDIAEELAEELGVGSGEAILQRYAKNTALDAAVPDMQFDPGAHLCMATVRWKPPVFIKEAVLRFAEQLKRDELGQAADPASAESSASGSGAASESEPRPLISAPEGTTAAATQKQTSSMPVRCKREKGALSKVLRDGQKVVRDLRECLRRTGQDETICHRYKLHADEAQTNEQQAGTQLCDCLNAGLSTTLRLALGQALDSHAAMPVETKGDGTVVVWTYSPVENTAFAMEVSPDGKLAEHSPLDQAQAEWMRQQIGL